MKTEIWLTHRIGGWDLNYKKTFDLPFTPFMGLTIMDTKDDSEMRIELANHDYCRTLIYWENGSDEMVVDVNNKWPDRVSIEEFDNTIKYLDKLGWTRVSRDIDIERFREFIKSKQ